MFLYNIVNHFRNSPRESGAITAVRAAPLLIIFLAVALGAYGLSEPSGYMFRYSFAFMALTCGLAVSMLFAPGENREILKAFIILIAANWVVSISVGYNSPALASGAAVLVLILFCRRELDSIFSGKTAGYVLNVTVSAIALLAVAAFSCGRLNHVYRDAPYKELKSHAGNVLDGGSGIYTNANTYAVLKDLKEITANLDGGYAVVPAFACHWVKAPRPNPLPIDWANNEEIEARSLRERVMAELKNRKDFKYILVQKHVTRFYKDKFLPEESNIIVTFVRKNFTKSGETPYFEIYK
jgi:hypothetical protein